MATSLHCSKIDKRDLDDDSSLSKASFATKKRKVESPQVQVPTGDGKQEKINSSELASALALASLAAFSLTSPSNKTPNTTSVQSSSSWEESRSPKATEAPVTPDQRAPGSPGASTKTQDEAVSTPDSASSRRVTFCPSTKEEGTTNPTSILKSKRLSPSRRIVMPTQHNQAVNSLSFMTRRPPSIYGFSPTAQYRTPPPIPHHHPHPVHILHSPHAPFHHASQAWYHGAHRAASMNSRGPYLQRLMQPALLHPENQWICDYCNVASFGTYEEACAHEETCRCRYSAHKGTRHPLPASRYAIQQAMSRSHSVDDEASLSVQSMTSASAENWKTGCLSLSIEETDGEWLSELNCFIRKNCVEAFSATEEDVSRSSKRGRISLNQVGIRCRFCKCSESKDKEAASVSFPTSISGIYESVKRWQRVHLDSCTLIPPETKQKLASLANTNVWVPTTRQYWTDSAKAMGLVDTNEGIRFGISPDDIKKRLASSDISIKLQLTQAASTRHHSNQTMLIEHANQTSNAHATATTHFLKPMSMNSIGGSGLKETKHETEQNPSYIVLPEDMDMIPPYVYFLMRQVEPCKFTEADRFVARSKGPVGYPGFQCRHCAGHAGLGKYFPVSSKSLSTNSTSQNIHAHLLKCRKCPDQIKDQLVQLKIEKGRMPRLEPGWRRVFFEKVWKRMHG